MFPEAVKPFLGVIAIASCACVPCPAEKAVAATDAGTLTPGVAQTFSLTTADEFVPASFSTETGDSFNVVVQPAVGPSRDRSFSWTFRGNPEGVIQNVERVSATEVRLQVTLPAEWKTAEAWVSLSRGAPDDCSQRTRIATVRVAVP